MIYLKRFLPLCMIIIGLICFFHFELNQYFTFEELKENRAYILLLVESHYFSSIIIFMALYIILVAFSVPGATFLTVTSGFLFKTWLGALYSLISATVGSILIFLVVKRALEPYINSKMNIWIIKMRNKFHDNELNYLFFLRLAPIFPFWMVNIIAALLGARIKTFFISTFIGIIPLMIILSLLGNGLDEIFDNNENPNLSILLSWKIYIPLCLLGFISIFPIFFHHKKNSFTK
ncbi:VTT domain-containing protein [Gammaproteobacteria bacterium]|nr:VTT domain-containing protein [Gammaproteobacteria bacterium]